MTSRNKKSVLIQFLWCGQLNSGR